MKKLYSVKDGVAEFFLPAFVADNDNMAKRIFLLSMGDQFVHRGDYTLFQLAEFNDQTGEISETELRFVLNGLSLSPEMDPRPRPLAPSTQENIQ